MTLPPPFPPPMLDLHLAVREIGCLRFGGFRGCWRYKPRGHHLFDQEEVRAALATIPPVDVFVSHNSPRGIHDREDAIHTGFEAFNDYIQRTRPQWFFHGHQHVDRETLVGGTQVIGVFGHRFVNLH